MFYQKAPNKTNTLKREKAPILVYCRSAFFYRLAATPFSTKEQPTLRQSVALRKSSKNKSGG